MILGTYRWVRLFVIAVVATLGLSLATSSSAQAANTNPIRWLPVFKTLYGPHGEDIPLRYGQHDQGPIDGFGTRHIEDGHDKWGDWDETADMIEHVIQTGKCSVKGTTHNCSLSGSYLFVAVWSSRVDSRSGDGRPVGVITFYAVCQTCKAVGA
ncbi:putative Predicted protein [Nostocoides japonicum T1-X7]|uniref:Secreted protein n=1 Tax=Nostocoides japonicum T1-X7 TaxID=1194083 RepID=A0A077LWK7_9MICO|nr:putative Predicted protein [Tetrasphaera japonica T1-X7]